jgi:hypothetical protein
LSDSGPGGAGPDGGGAAIPVSGWPLSLRIPADPTSIATARSFAGSIARVLGVSDTLRHDLRLAVSELITLAIVGGADHITMTAESEGPGAALRIATNSLMPTVPPETSALLGVILVSSIWSDRDPWVIRIPMTSTQ